MKIVHSAYLGATLITISLSNEKVLVTANPHPASNPRLIIGQVVAGGAEANPKGFKNFNPHKDTLKSISSIGEKQNIKSG